MTTTLQATLDLFFVKSYSLPIYHFLDQRQCNCYDYGILSPRDAVLLPTTYFQLISLITSSFVVCNYEWSLETVMNYHIYLGKLQLNKLANPPNLLFSYSKHPISTIIALCLRINRSPRVLYEVTSFA